MHETATADRRREDDAGFFSAYNTYVALMTIRALIILGYVLDGNASLPGADVPVRLHRNGEVLVCTIDRAGVLTISVDGEALTRIVSLSHDLTAPVPDHTRQKWINQIRSVENTIIVYPGVRDERRQLAPEARSVLHSSQRGIVPISPVEIEGEERLARALRWPLQAARYVSGYPVVLPARTELPNADWYRAGERGKVEILRRPDDAELARLTAANKPGSPRRRGDDELRHFIDQLGEADRRLAVLDTCPLCPNGRAVMTARPDGTFVCRCDSCSTTWGLNPCGSCRERYPFLWPRNAVVDTAHGDRLDMTAGADLLAEPCAAPTDHPVPRFRCCWCDHCAGAPNCGCAPRPGHTFVPPGRSGKDLSRPRR